MPPDTPGPDPRKLQFISDVLVNWDILPHQRGGGEWRWTRLTPNSASA